jgi:hypothetical protein
VDSLAALAGRATRVGARVARADEEGRSVMRIVLPEAPDITWAAIERPG